jgi:hypothetical protein
MSRAPGTALVVSFGVDLLKNLQTPSLSRSSHRRIGFDYPPGHRASSASETMKISNLLTLMPAADFVARGARLRPFPFQSVGTFTDGK